MYKLEAIKKRFNGYVDTVVEYIYNNGKAFLIIKLNNFSIMQLSQKERKILLVYLHQNLIDS